MTRHGLAFEQARYEPSVFTDGGKDNRLQVTPVNYDVR
jgi:hypothetical protein